jgi:transposase
METLSSPSSSQTTTDLKEWRRLRACELSQQGWKQSRIAQAIHVTEGAISQWLSRARAGGSASLRRRKPPGPKPRLSPGQKEQIRPLLAQGAPAFGFAGDVWTRAGSRRSSGTGWASATTSHTSGGCCTRWVSRERSLSSEPPGETRLPSPTGNSASGPV